MFTEDEDALIDAYVQYFETIEVYLKAEELYEDAAAQCRKCARKLPNPTLQTLGRYMREAAERGDFPDDHPVVRNLDRSIDLAEEYLQMVGKSTADDPLAGNPVI